MDEAHEWTEEEIERLTKRLRHEYSQAEKEMRQKLEKLMADFDEQNKDWQARMAAGKSTRNEYEAWLKDMSMNREFVEDMADTLAQDAVNADKRAMELINDAIPTVYAENANRAAYGIDSALGQDHSFDLYDQSTVRRLISSPDADLLPPIPNPKVDARKDKPWNRRKFNSAITQSILQGESIPDTAKRLQTVLKMDEGAAVRAARTAMTGAENAGRVDSYRRAKALGIDMEQQWMATLDMRTRHSHRQLDGQHVPVGEKFKVDGIELEFPGDPTAPAEYVYNCFVGDTLSVPLGGVERSFGRLYEGDAVTVRTSRGVEFTCTPNHPILTTQGWVPAGFLDDGYDLVVAGIGNGLVLRDNPDIEHVGTRMDAIHELCSELASQGAARLDVNFHEDVLARDVDVITQERPLRVNAKTFELEPVDKLRLELPDALAPSDGAKVKFLNASMTASDGFVSGSGESGPLRWASVSHALEHRLRTVAGNDSHAFEPAGYGTSTDAEVLRESLDGLSAVIEFDHVIDVDVHPVSCHVYNLQTESGAYLVTNNDSVPLFAISHNCRCTLVAWFPDLDKDERWSKLPNGMTYDEWKSGKKAEKKRQEAAGVVNGKDILGTWKRREGEFDFEIEDVMNAQGFDGKPRTVDADEFDRAVRQANGGDGLIMQRTYSAPDKETLDVYRQQLYDGKWYVDCSTGGAEYGQGMYCAGDWSKTLSDRTTVSMRHYASLYDGPSYIETMTLDSSARVVKTTDLAREAAKARSSIIDSIADEVVGENLDAAGMGEMRGAERDYLIDLAAGKRPSANISPERYGMSMEDMDEFGEYLRFLTDERASSDAMIIRLEGMDEGVLATALGYDAIDVSGQGYIVVLNRTKLIIKEPE